jgi:hypothetical protein
VEGGAEPCSDLGWMALQARTLFTFDANGRILARREPAASRAPAPRFFLGRTRHGHLWRFRADVPASLVRDLARLAAQERVDRDPDLPPEREAALRALLEAHAPVEHAWAGPAFRFPEHELTAQSSPDGVCVVPVTSANASLVAESFPSWLGELAERQPVLVALEGGGRRRDAGGLSRPRPRDARQRRVGAGRARARPAAALQHQLREPRLDRSRAPPRPGALRQ